MKEQELIPHLFRTEYSKIVAVICNRFGFDQIALAEDIASDTFLTAVQTWPYKGLPQNPAAWLYQVAKNKAKNHLQRNSIFNSRVTPQLNNDGAVLAVTDIDLSAQNIQDSQLQMMFAICHPSIPAEAQIGLALRILCGFGIEEIATAFLTNKETINKRLFRAREKLRLQNVQLAFPPAAEINKRLETVLTTLYLLFSEGYYSESHDSVLREDLCLEAMRLTYLLLENKYSNQPKVNALLSLMCFHASRFKARADSQGELILYEDQDEKLWNAALITKAAMYLREASQGNHISTYHLEASIAYWHTIKADTPEKWSAILQLYNQLLQLTYSPMAALNRTYALSKVHGKPEAIMAAEKLGLTNNRFYYVLLGELYSGIDKIKATDNFKKALAITKTIAEKQAIQKKIDKL
ncbi:MAG: DUF6596 domain-containing protein [Chitinophagaceae bacterium]